MSTPRCSCDPGPNGEHHPWCETNHPNHPCDDRLCRFASDSQGGEPPVTPAEEFRTAARVVREVASEATGGPWLARFTDPAGKPIVDRAPGWSDAEEAGDEDEGILSLVAGSALPAGPDEVGPASYEATHLLAECSDDLHPDEAAELYGSLRWAALMCPLLAEPLAQLFDSAALVAEQAGADYADYLMVRVARLILRQHDAMQGGED